MINTPQTSINKFSLHGERFFSWWIGFIGHHLALKLKNWSDVLIIDDMQVNNIVKILTSKHIEELKENYIKFF